MQKAIVFLSQSFDEGDKDFVLELKTLIQANDSVEKVVDYRDLSFERMAEGIQGLIRACDVVVAIFSKRYEVAGLPSDEERYLPPPMVIAEANFALGANRHVVSIVESGVSRKHVGFHYLDAVEIPSISYPMKETVKHALSNAFDRFFTKRFGDTISQERVHQLSFQRRAFVWPDRIDVENVVRARVEDRSRFDGFVQSIMTKRSSNNAPTDLSLEKLIETPPSWLEPYLEAFCAGRGSQGVRTPMKIEPRDPEDGRLYFALVPDFNVQSGDVIEYDYTWSLPLSACPATPAGDQFVALEPVRGMIDRVELEVWFPAGTSFDLEPHCHDADSASSRHPAARPHPSVIWDSYVWWFRNFSEAAVIEWRV